MKITEKLIQFKNSPSLLVMTGWQSAKIYYALDGELEVLEDFEIENREYSDKEGFFKSKSSNVGGMGSGAPIKEDRDTTRKEFLDELIRKINLILKSKKIKDIYLFAPDEGLHSLGESLNKEIKKIIKSYYTGNYIKLKPFDIIKKIEKEKTKPVDLMSEEAKKILEKNKK